MADKYLNKTVLNYWYNRMKTVFASVGSLTELETKVDEIIAEGGESNIIEAIKVNNTELPIVDKTVNIDLSDYATENYVDENGGKIDKIKVNSVEQVITNKEVNITIPTSVSSLANDIGYQTASDVSSSISQAVASAYIYKGSVATVDALPTGGNTIGDVYDVQSTGVNYAWTGSEWDALGSYVDTGVLWTSVTGQSNTLEAITIAEIDAILNAE